MAKGFWNFIKKVHKVNQEIHNEHSEKWKNFTTWIELIGWPFVNAAKGDKSEADKNKITKREKWTVWLR